MLSFRTLPLVLALVPPAAGQMLLPATHAGAAPVGWTEQVRTELAADLIARGRILERDAGSLERAVVAGGAYVRLELEVRERLKGEFGGRRVPVTFFAAPREHPHHYVPTAEDMRRLIGQDRVFYLLRYTDHHYFLADRFGGTAIRPPTPAILDSIRNSVAEHEAMATSEPPADPDLAPEIKTLLDFALEGPDQQIRAFMQLDRLGMASIPTLVACLDDDRKLPTQAVILQDTTERAIPVLREYRPQVVSDAICTLLHQRTGEQFGLDYSRPRSEQRWREHACWRVYAHYVAADPAYGVTPGIDLLAGADLDRTLPAVVEETPPAADTPVADPSKD